MIKPVETISRKESHMVRTYSRPAGVGLTKVRFGLVETKAVPKKANVEPKEPDVDPDKKYDHAMIVLRGKNKESPTNMILKATEGDDLTFSICHPQTRVSEGKLWLLVEIVYIEKVMSLGGRRNIQTLTVLEGKAEFKGKLQSVRVTLYPRYSTAVVRPLSS